MLSFFSPSPCRMMHHFLLNRTFLFSASIFVKLKKPNAAIRDANAALEVCSVICLHNLCKTELCQQLCINYMFFIDKSRLSKRVQNKRDCKSNVGSLGRSGKWFACSIKVRLWWGDWFGAQKGNSCSLIRWSFDTAVAWLCSWIFRLNRMQGKLKSIAENMNVCEKKGSQKKLNVRGRDNLKPKWVELICIYTHTHIDNVIGFVALTNMASL